MGFYGVWKGEELWGQCEDLVGTITFLGFDILIFIQGSLYEWSWCGYFGRQAQLRNPSDPALIK